MSEGGLPEDFGGRVLPTVTASGPWQRLHPGEYDAAYFGKTGASRFDDPRGEYGVLYVAEDAFGAFVETFLRNPELMMVDSSELERRSLSEIGSSSPLTLVDLTGEGLQKAGVTGELVTGDRAGTQALSRAIHEHPSRPDGIRYRLKHDLGRVGVAVFERSGESVRVREGRRGGLLEPGNRQLLGEILDEYGKTL